MRRGKKGFGKGLKRIKKRERRRKKKEEISQLERKALLARITDSLAGHFDFEPRLNPRNFIMGEGGGGRTFQSWHCRCLFL